jgi:hypothetical protein
LKSILVDTDWFKSLTGTEKIRALNTHSLRDLWDKIKDKEEIVRDAPDVATVERQLLELHNLDVTSDGFRYPYGFDWTAAAFRPVLPGLAGSSFDNFVWVLEALNNWLSASQDVKAERRQMWSEMREYESPSGGEMRDYDGP